ncbi:leucine-rich repeat-containing protein 27-like [Periplaneta americana]|uniref:leucine-rich repeat-containing protein 27-like n=1 Tax=Periplaneta americana TaxID=6978 RepID=UPI0037E99BC3
MNGYDNTYDEGEGAPQNKYSEINTIDSEEQIIPGPGNASFFDLSRKHLRQFPEYLYDECLYVKYLYLEGNLLQELCEIFFPALPSLKWLDVRNNFLTSLPRSIANHPNLEVLLLQGNQIRVLPLELGLVPKLRGIQLLGNPITFPPQDVLEHGVKSVIEFLRDEHNIQAPSPSTIRPIAEPFYKSTESREGKMKTRSGQKRKSPALVKKRAVSSNLPPITVKSYQKPDSKSDPPRPKTSQPVCRYQLAMTPPTQNDIEVTEDMSTRIQSVGNKILQLWPHPTDMCKREAKIRDNLLKEMFVARIRYMLQQQAAIIQRTKDREVLRKWRQTGAPIRQRQGQHYLL